VPVAGPGTAKRADVIAARTAATNVVACRAESRIRRSRPAVRRYPPTATATRRADSAIVPARLLQTGVRTAAAYPAATAAPSASPLVRPRG